MAETKMLAICDFCEKEDQLFRCEIKDRMGTRYRNLCEACIEETSKNGIVTIIDQDKDVAKGLAGAIYSVKGVRGRQMDVYEDKCVITTFVTLGSLLTHNATDGRKTIYYSDVVGVQFKEPGVTIGYLQLETSASVMNNSNSNP